MKQMSISGDLIVKVHYKASGNSEYFRQLRPVVYRDIGTLPVCVVLTRVRAYRVQQIRLKSR